MPRHVLKTIDRIDIKLLSALQRDGRATTLKLANEIGLSSSPCHVRLRRLEDSGVIGSYRADINMNKLAHTVMVIVPVELAHHEAKDFKHFESRIKEIPEIVECYAVGGGFDYILRVVARDVESYQNLMENLLEDEIGIHRYFSYIITKPIKRFEGYPLADLLEPFNLAPTQTGAASAAGRRREAKKGQDYRGDKLRVVG